MKHLHFQVVLQDIQANESISSQFLKGQRKSYELFEMGIKPKIIIEELVRLSFPNFNYRLETKRKYLKFFSFVQENRCGNGWSC